MNGRRPISQRSDYLRSFALATRWADNDGYGHINNAAYVSYLDTVVNGFLIRNGALDARTSDIIGVVAETKFQYFKSIAFPDEICAGLRVPGIGRTSVRYEIGIFKNEEEDASAEGHFIHVYIDRASGCPVLVPEAVKTALAPLIVANSAVSKSTSRVSATR